MHKLSVVLKLLLVSILILNCSEKNTVKIDKSWAAIGTSITYNDEKMKGYQSNVMDAFIFKNYSNLGYSGYSLGKSSKDDMSYILNPLKTKSWGKFDIYSLESITNDFKKNLPLGTESDFKDNTGVETYYGALRIFKDKINSLNPNAIIICANGITRNNDNYSSTSINKAGQTLIDYNEALENIAVKNNWIFIDQFRYSGITNNNLNLTTADGLHPNELGYALISDIWIKTFMNIK